MIHKTVQVALLLVLILYIFYGFDIKNINPEKFSIFGLLISICIIFFSQIMLAIRWMKMSSLSFIISFETIIVSSALNMILPAKMGELSKAIYLRKFYKFNYHKSISIIFVERFFDIIVLFLLLILWSYSYVANEIIKNTILMLSLLIPLTVFFFSMNNSRYLIKKIPLQFFRVYLQKIFLIVNKLFKSPISLSWYTLLLWLTYFTTTALFYTLAVEFKLSMHELLGLFIFSTIALAVPLAPAGLGTYEGAVVLYLSQYGISKEDALLAASLYHLLLFIVDFVLLYLFLLIKKITFKELIQS